MPKTPTEAIKEFVSEYTPENIKLLRYNCSARGLAEIIYREQQKYVGCDHEKYCQLMLAYLLDHLVAGLASDIQPTTWWWK